MPTPAPPPAFSLPPGIRLLRLKFRLLSAISTEWAFAEAWKLFTTPRQLPQKGWEAAVLASARQFTVTSSNTDIVAYEWNPAGKHMVLLVHGWEHRASFWGILVQALVAAGYRVVALDGPAHGASGGTRTTLPAFARAVQAVADAAGPVYGVVAHSFGGAATVGVPVQFNQLQGGRLPRLVLLAVPGSTTAVAQRFTALLQLPAAVVQRMGRHIRQQHGRDAESFSLVQVGHRFPTEKALLLHDRQDESIPFAEAQEVADSWPGLDFRATVGLGHNRIMRDPQVLRQIVDFLGAS
ncbi:alpha/beta fold hydrolase [Hymenobacter metallilatus]|uniref:Alpha/beta hydrolase n=1 Tax=Hymenobacter metallilatus TaxID=2493666 RepID=A0A3R9P734_9BACT|nr:alpha/beta hydrolase [Hymenobacter metallilatus]RSK29619.1 alpha/beta hydrolase [Hymenobacter metallilatus]